MALSTLTMTTLWSEARAFADLQTSYPEPALFGVTDGKAVGTYLEHKFKAYLAANYSYEAGNSASGIDFPDLAVDMKVTSIRQPQSSCPFNSARQKIFGLGYSLLVFVYDKSDDPTTRTATLRILHTVFVDQKRTADYQTTLGLRQIIENGGNEEEIIAFMRDRYLPVDDLEAQSIAEDLLNGLPMSQGYLTISNALQWRLQYSRIIAQAGQVEGIERLGQIDEC